MRNKGWVFTGLLVAMLAGVAGVANAAMYPNDRGNWYLGFGIGGGSAGLSDNSGNTSDRTSGTMASLRGGYMLNPKVALAIEGNGWSKEENGVTVTFTATTAGVAFFPAEGLVLRGGIGAGQASIAEKVGSVTGTTSESGFGFNYGVGYEFRLTHSFALGPQLDGGYTSIKGGSANWIGGGLEFNWYFIPRK